MQVMEDRINIGVRTKVKIPASAMKSNVSFVLSVITSINANGIDKIGIRIRIKLQIANLLVLGLSAIF